MHAGELLKAQAYLALAPHDDKSQHNMSLLRQRLAQRLQPQAGRRVLIRRARRVERSGGEAAGRALADRFLRLRHAADGAVLRPEHG